MVEIPNFREPRYKDEHGSHNQYLDFLGALTFFTNALATDFAADKVKNLLMLGTLEFQLRTGAVEIGDEAPTAFESTKRIYKEIDEYSKRNPKFREAIEKMVKAVRDFST